MEGAENAGKEKVRLVIARSNARVAIDSIEGEEKRCRIGIVEEVMMMMMMISITMALTCYCFFFNVLFSLLVVAAM